MTHHSYPSVTPIIPPSPLPTSHHGPVGSRSLNPLAGSSCSPASGSSSTPAKPRYFKNPWPSYRTASLHDAYLAYQLGAAVAFAPSHHTPGTSRLNLNEMAHEPLDDPDVEDSYRYQDDHDDDDGEETRAMIPKTPASASASASASGSRPASRIYVRKEFAEVKLDDAMDDWRDPPCEVVEPSWGDGKDGRERVTWLGHAGVLVQIPWQSRESSESESTGREGTCGVLFDPIFSYRCSPSQYVGPARYLDPPCPVSMLPEIHICCISHDHYDHLDYYTIMDLWKYHQATIHFFVPLGLKAWFTASGIPEGRVTELDWWHESLVSFPSAPSLVTATTDNELQYPPPSLDLPSTPLPANLSVRDSDLTLKIAFTPAQHRSGRGVFDHMTTLWGSWCVGVVEPRDAGRAGERGMRDWEGFKVFFGGDTGYRYATALEGDETAICPAFSDIATHYSPLSLSLLPLSTGSSLPFLRTLLSLSLDQYTLTSSLHCSPADSLEIHRIVRSERTVGIHWGTFCDADEARGTRVEFGRSRRGFGICGFWSDEEHEGEGMGENEERAEGGRGKGRFVVADIGETLVIPRKRSDSDGVQSH